MKRIFCLFSFLLAVVLPANPPRPQGPPPGEPPMHPLVKALESPEFTPEERETLKKMAKEEPDKFFRTMRIRFMEARKKEAQKTLDLRKACLDAKTPEEKAKAEAALREDVRQDMERKLKMHQQILDGTEKSIQNMQKRLESLRAEHEKMIQNKDAEIDRRFDKLLKEDPSKRLLRDAAWTPEKENGCRPPKFDRPGHGHGPHDHPEPPPPPPLPPSLPED